jgi:hypothetical protein
MSVIILSFMSITAFFKFKKLPWFGNAEAASGEKIIPTAKRDSTTNIDLFDMCTTFV